MKCGKNDLSRFVHRVIDMWRNCLDVRDKTEYYEEACDDTPSSRSRFSDLIFEGIDPLNQATADILIFQLADLGFQKVYQC
jgi:hypothetical protein